MVLITNGLIIYDPRNKILNVFHYQRRHGGLINIYHACVGLKGGSIFNYKYYLNTA